MYAAGVSEYLLQRQQDGLPEQGELLHWEACRIQDGCRLGM